MINFSVEIFVDEEHRLNTSKRNEFILRNHPILLPLPFPSPQPQTNKIKKHIQKRFHFLTHKFV